MTVSFLKSPKAPAHRICAGFGVLLLPMAALLWSGCAHFESKPIAPAAMLAEFQGRTLDDTELKAFLRTNGVDGEWPRRAWDFKALTLAAFYYNPDLDLARAHWAVAKAGGKTAAERPNPSVSVGPSYNTSTAVPSPWLLTASLDIPFETAGKRGYRIAEAAQLTESARLNIVATAWQVRSRVRRALSELYFATEEARLLGEQQTLLDETVRLLERQRRLGASSAYELTQAKIAADGARLQLRDAERQRAESRGQLADAVGVPSQALMHVELGFGDLLELPDTAPAEAVRRQALLNRPDILGALAEYNASQAALQSEIAKQYPDIHLNPGYEFDQGDNKWSPGFTVTLPILNRNKGPIAEAEARRAEAAAGFSALQARVVGEIDRAVAAYEQTIRKRGDAEAVRENLVRQEKTAWGMYEAGEISKGDLAAVRLQLGASALARLDAVQKSLQAYQQLEDAVQSPMGLPDNLWLQSPRNAQSRL
jgi:outer membrane protein, heavy metal efflux system